MPSRTEPRVTLNALADYLTASAGRRRSIVTDQKSPKTFRVAYYADAEDAVIGALSGGGTGDALDHLARGRAKVMATHATKEWEQARRDTQLEAIEAARAFLESDVASPLLGLTTHRRRTAALLVSGVHVSVRPELFIADTTNATTGAIKLYFSKSGALPDERARYAGAILHRFVESLSPDASADYRSCFVVDVFARRLHAAPRTYRRRRQDIDAACSEIAATWGGDSRM